MAYSITLKTRKGNAEELRAEGNVPGVIYGPDREPISVYVPYNDLDKLYQEAGESTLVDVTVEGEQEAKVLIQDVQYDPVKGRYIHVDFRQIDMNKPMYAATELKFIGESPAVKELGGTLVKPIEHLNIKCLPKDLVSEIEVDLSKLNNFEDVIHVKDLNLPAGITVEDNMDNVIAKVSAPLTDEQLKAMEESQTKSIDDVEGMKKEEDKEKEGEEKKSEEKK